jgi:hypothetical protein
MLQPVYDFCDNNPKFMVGFMGVATVIGVSFGVFNYRESAALRIQLTQAKKQNPEHFTGNSVTADALPIPGDLNQNVGGRSEFQNVSAKSLAELYPVSPENLSIAQKLVCDKFTEQLLTAAESAPLDRMCASMLQVSFDICNNLENDLIIARKNFHKRDIQYSKLLKTYKKLKRANRQALEISKREVSAIQAGRDQLRQRLESDVAALQRNLVEAQKVCDLNAVHISSQEQLLAQKEAALDKLKKQNKRLGNRNFDLQNELNQQKMHTETYRAACNSYFNNDQFRSTMMTNLRGRLTDANRESLFRQREILRLRWEIEVLQRNLKITSASEKDAALLLEKMNHDFNVRDNLNKEQMDLLEAEVNRVQEENNSLINTCADQQINLRDMRESNALYVECINGMSNKLEQVEVFIAGIEAGLQREAQEKKSLQGELEKLKKATAWFYDSRVAAIYVRLTPGCQWNDSVRSEFAKNAQGLGWRRDDRVWFFPSDRERILTLTPGANLQ